MKKVFSSPHNAEVELVKHMLSNNGVVCEVRNGDVSRIVPAPSFYEELWVSEENYPRAMELVNAWQRPPPVSTPAWKCPNCGEVVEGQFTSCWKCGATRPQMA